MYPSNAYVMTINFCFSNFYYPSVTLAKEYNPDSDYDIQVRDIIEIIKGVSCDNPHISSVKFLQEMYQRGFSDDAGDFDLRVMEPGFLHSLNIFYNIDGGFQIKDYEMQDIRSLQRYL